MPTYPSQQQIALLLLLGSGLIAPAIGCESEETCADCRDEKCSDLVAICSEDTNCKCMSNCLGDEGIPGVDACLATCELSERPARFIPVEDCVATACPDSDECSTPSGYSPPDTANAANATDTVLMGGGTLADCSFDPDLSYDPEGTVLQLESADKNVCVRLQRRDDGAGSLANTNWSLVDIRVGPLGSVAHIDDPAAMCWYSSHHNFRDWVHVWTGSTHHDLRLEEDGHGGPRQYELHTFEQRPLVDGESCSPTADGSGPLGGPIDLFPFTP